jgi:uncharacterized protein
MGALEATLSGALPEGGLGLLVLGAVLAGLVRGFTGFGTALVYMPFAAQVLPPVWGLVTLIVIDLIGPLPAVPRALRDGDPPDVLRLGAGAVVGVPLGALVLTALDPEVFRYTLSALRDPREHASVPASGRRAADRGFRDARADGVDPAGAGSRADPALYWRPDAGLGDLRSRARAAVPHRRLRRDRRLGAGRSAALRLRKEEVMRLNEVRFTDAQPVDGYGPGFFRVAGEVHEGAIAVLPSGVTAWGGYDDRETLLAAAGEIDVLFVGTGAETAHVPAGFRAALEEAGIGVESMASAPACRTYNVLLSEGRRVAVALLPV